jgi:hypothetical protein
MAKERDREPDIVRELQEDAEWSMWTNSFVRRRGWGRGSLPSNPGVRTFMLAAVLVVAAALGTVGIIVLLFKLS